MSPHRESCPGDQFNPTCVINIFQDSNIRAVGITITGLLWYPAACERARSTRGRVAVVWITCCFFPPFFFFRWRLTRPEESRELDDAKVFIDTSARQIRKSPLIRDAIRSRHTPHETWSVELYKGGSAGNDNDACLSLKVIHLVYRHAPYDAYHFGGPRCNCVHSKKSGNHSSPCCKCQSIQHGPII